MQLEVINGRVFDGSSPELLDATISVADGVIARVERRGPGDADGFDVADATVLDARGGTVIPGMIDAHFHAYGIELNPLTLEQTPSSYVALAGARRLRAAMRRGFTTVRDVAGGDPGLARAIATGLIEAPRYLYTGPALSQTGGHGDARPGDLDVCVCNHHMFEKVDGVDALRRAVRERFRRGAHAIKLMTSGGVTSPSDPIRPPQYSTEEILAVTDEAARRGSYVAAHALSSEAIAHSVLAGVRSIEHGNLLDAQTAALMADHGAFLIPTLAAYDALGRRGAELGLMQVSLDKNREVLDAGRAAIEVARAAGVPVGWGSDLIGELETDQLYGLQLQAEVTGPLELLRSVTSVNACVLGLRDRGRIAPGALADMVVLPGDPLRNPDVLWDKAVERIVIRGGCII